MGTIAAVQIRVSPEVNALLDDATALSARRGRNFVGIDILLEVLLGHRDILPACITSEVHKHLNVVLQEVQRTGWQGRTVFGGNDVFYTPRFAETMNEAARLGQRLKQQPGALHVLLALFGDDRAASSRAMDRLGMPRQALLEALRHEAQQRREPVHAAARPTQAAAATAVAAHNAEPAPDESPREPARRSPLERLTRDLTALAEAGAIEPAVGRSHETFEVLEILTRKNKNNVIITGEAGVGKTRVVEGLAALLASGRTSEILAGCRVLELNLAALSAGTQYRGAFEERLQELLDEVKAAGNVILFIDEIHLIMGAGATEGGGADLANLLKPALARGDLRCIGATTFREYRKFIEKDPAIERRFQMVRIEELSPDDTRKVLEALKPSLETHHQVRVSRRALEAAIQLTERYMPQRRFPDKAIDVLDQACARYRLRKVAAAAKEERGAASAASRHALEKEKVTPHDIRKVVSRATSIPIEEITAAERERLEDLERRLKRRVLGQELAVEKAVAAVKKSRAGLADPNRPDAVMLFMGPTGVGKTQLAQSLADSLFGSRKHLKVFDMSEYTEEHSVSRLIGAPPGYVGSDEEGRLTAAVRDTPFSILLFDEVEKAHPRIFDLFLPILDEGRLKDAYGRDVSFRNCVIIFTSNIGGQAIEPDDSGLNEDVVDALSAHFRPEFINRIDDVVPFFPLVFEDVRAILKLSLQDVAARLKEKGIGLRVYQGAYEHLADKGYSRAYGARELRRTVERLVVEPLSDRVLKREFGSGDCVEVLMQDEQLIMRRGAPGKDAEGSG